MVKGDSFSPIESMFLLKVKIYVESFGYLIS